VEAAPGRARGVLAYRDEPDTPLARADVVTDFGETRSSSCSGKPGWPCSAPLRRVGRALVVRQV